MTSKKKGTDDTKDKLETILEHIEPAFIEEGARRIGPEEVDKVIGQLKKVLRQFERGEALGRFKKDAALMASALRDFKKGRYKGFSFWTVSLITFTFHYLLKPIDIIPDTLPVIGRLDDAVVLSHCLVMIKRELQDYKIWKLAQEICEP
jgi:uncharacterized membrane protein YkvA (DUF1232 family)